MMGPIASRLWLAFALIGSHISPTLADDFTSRPGLRTQDATLPAFVPPSGRGKYTTAVDENSASAMSARNAAETLSAKFSDITTSSMSSDDHASTAASIAQTDPPHATTEDGDARTIVLASNQAGARPTEDEKSANTQIHPRHSKAIGHSIPRSVLRKASAVPPHGQSESTTSLAAIGQKVGILNFLTNPALWH